MVSILLLTTEEVLQRNTFWFRLDTLWFTEEMEPFEEIKEDDIFAKPISRDYYYAKYSDIPRSESEDENSLSLNGFKCNHTVWKAKMRVKRSDGRRRNSCQSRSGSENNETKKFTSLVETRHKELSEQKSDLRNNNDERVVNFLKRLQENIPPPPIEELQLLPNISNDSIEYPKHCTNFSDIELPEYADFKNFKMQQSERHLLPVTSTLKKVKRKVSFNLSKFNAEFESDESWNDSIYGVSDLIHSSYDYILEGSDDRNSNYMDKDSHVTEYFPTWSEILRECDINDDSLLQSTESLFVSEQMISQSHLDTKIEYPETDENDYDAGYARFAIYKIYQTLKIEECMPDSSSMIDLSENENNFTDQSRRDSLLFGTIYRLTPSSIDS